MNILIADADAPSRLLLETTVRQWGYQPLAVADGARAWEVLSGRDPPPLAILDWELPDYPGPELCRKARALDKAYPLYAMVLTSRNDRAEMLAGLRAGADDLLTKPFDRHEMYARLTAGARIVQLQQSLADKVRRLEEALVSAQKLQGMVPMCCYCKSVRDDRNCWRRLEDYLAEHKETAFSHGICPQCFKAVAEPEIQAAHAKSAARRSGC
jgi:phosphoserine phosphatase RsbU/P